MEEKAMGGQSWKQLERTVAKKLGGTRVYRGNDFSKSLPDVNHFLFSIECKYRKTLPKLYMKVFDLIRPTNGSILVCTHRDRIVLTLDGFVEFGKSSLVETTEYFIPEERKYNKFLEDAYAQAVSYAPDKIPLVVMKQVGMRGELVYLSRLNRDWWLR